MDNPCLNDFQFQNLDTMHPTATIYLPSIKVCICAASCPVKHEYMHEWLQDSPY
jgi:hypothetical protein